MDFLADLHFSLIHVLSMHFQYSADLQDLSMHFHYSADLQETDWAGLLHLIKFYKSRRFDATIGLPRLRSSLWSL